MIRGRWAAIDVLPTEPAQIPHTPGTCLDQHTGVGTEPRVIKTAVQQRTWPAQPGAVGRLLRHADRDMKRHGAAGIPPDVVEPATPAVFGKPRHHGAAIVEGTERACAERRGR